MGRRGVGLVAGLLLAAAAAWLLATADWSPDPISAGEPAPGFELPRLADGAPVSLADQRGRVVLINFWATWCKPCVEELPYFERLHEAFDGEKLRVVLVSLDFERDLETKLKDFVDKRGLQSDVLVLLDGNYNNWIDRVDPEWGGAIPVTVIYNAQKREFVGEQLPGYEELRHLVEGFL